MICLRHPLTPAAAAGLVLAALLVPSIVASAPVDATTSSTLDSGTRAALDKALNEGFAASGMPGVTVGLWIPDQGSWVASRGVADLGTGRPMTPDLQAPIGSITKTFTVMIALQLVGESRLSLDDTIDQWYPRITDASLIKVRMLMNHSSGIADISQPQVDRHCADPHHFASPEELIQIGAALPPGAVRPRGWFPVFEREHDHPGPDPGEGYQREPCVAHARAAPEAARARSDEARHRRLARAAVLSAFSRMLRI
jgi:D-alanyl-D-alanine carboxypeptidase